MPKYLKVRVKNDTDTAYARVGHVIRPGDDRVITIPERKWPQLKALTTISKRVIAEWDPLEEDEPAVAVDPEPAEDEPEEGDDPQDGVVVGDVTVDLAGNVPDVVAQVGDDVEVAEAVLAVEREGRTRKGVLSALEDVIAAAAETPDETPEAPEAPETPETPEEGDEGDDPQDGESDEGDGQ